MKRALCCFVSAALVAWAAACSGGGGEADATNPADSLTRRQKDSLISTMPIPGASAVGRALQAADSAAARAAAHDSLLGSGR